MISGAIGIGFALAGFGVWSLVARMLAHRALEAALLFGQSTPVLRLPSVPFLQVLSFTGMTFVMNQTLTPIPKALGRTYITLKLSIAKQLVSLATILVTFR